jgi:hypothetical protein
MQYGLTRRMLQALLLTLVASLVGASAALANPRPLAGLERFYAHTSHTSTQRIFGIGDNMSVYSQRTAKTLPVYGIGDNMSLYGGNTLKAKTAKQTTVAIRPDDRAGVRGVGFVFAKLPAVNDSSDVVSRALNRWLADHPVRPNDRAGALGIGAEATLGHWEKRLALN